MRLTRVGKRFRHVSAVHVRAILLRICCQQSDNSTACHVQARSRKQLAEVTLIICNNIFLQRYLFM